ncbi:MAG TPA: hypothetical protein VFW92_06295 [Candidatus Limnocylindrales bacterium]|nr:hypothetical protein [Candidatus Limnocylindrales bacterium]
MAVAQAVRMQSASTATLARRRQPARRRARRGTSRVGLALAAILVVTLLGLFYLSQTIGAATANYDIDGLSATHDRLERQLRSVEGDVYRYGAQPAILQGAQAAGLSPLGGSLRISGR